ncbi:hypothetical protein BKA59DRAFT_188202 [Fusarium tricinctum]|uniref:Uncharacterized protein n=1 Tax=Fusarium tricinctum TaxID=61284 RepID=A0A8K0RYA4_9HYPO|nr:hypothetical protein BKA59DRAFT_188202 [Fusarium tricinctum]
MKLCNLAAIAFFARPCFSRTSDEEIHLQWSLCDRDGEAVLAKLGEEVRAPYKRNPITYFDTMPPTHAQQGVMFRTKTNKGKPFSVIKVRFDEDPGRTPPGADCVWDRYGDNVPYTCGARYHLSEKTEELWSDDQVRFAEKYDDIDWDGLVPYGPFPDGKWKLRILGHKAKLDDVVADNLHLMEIELSTPKIGSEEVYSKVTEYLREHGVLLCDPQESKTLRLFRDMGYIDGNDGNDGNDLAVEDL